MALSSVPVQLLIWPCCQHTQPLLPISAAGENNLAGSCPLSNEGNRSSICKTAALPCHSFFFSLALHHLNSAGHRAQPDTPALGLQLPVTVAKELGILSHSGMAVPQGLLCLLANSNFAYAAKTTSW